MRTNYYGKVTVVDQGIGLVLEALRERGLMTDTWIIYTSDHGEMLGDHRLKHKWVFYDGALHIPCIIRPPGGIRGRTCTGLTDHFDLVATMLDIAGAGLLEGSDGRSLVPQIEAKPDALEAKKGKKVIFSEVNGYCMVRDERYKMIIDCRTRQPVEMYNMVNDPHELNNVVNDPSLEKVRYGLTEHLSRLLGNLDEARLRTFEEQGDDFSGMKDAVDMVLGRKNETFR